MGYPLPKNVFQNIFEFMVVIQNSKVIHPEIPHEFTQTTFSFCLFLLGRMDSNNGQSRWQRLYSKSSTTTGLASEDEEDDLNRVLSSLQTTFQNSQRIANNKTPDIDEWIEAVQCHADESAKILVSTSEPNEVGLMSLSSKPDLASEYAKSSHMSFFNEDVKQVDDIINEVEEMIGENIHIEDKVIFEQNDALEAWYDRPKEWIISYRCRSLLNTCFSQWCIVVKRVRMKRAEIINQFNCSKGSRLLERCFSPWSDQAQYTRAQVDDILQCRKKHESKRIFEAYKVWTNSITTGLDKIHKALKQKQIFSSWTKLFLEMKRKESMIATKRLENVRRKILCVWKMTTNDALRKDRDNLKAKIKAEEKKLVRKHKVAVLVDSLKSNSTTSTRSKKPNERLRDETWSELYHKENMNPQEKRISTSHNTGKSLRSHTRTKNSSDIHKRRVQHRDRRQVLSSQHNRAKNDSNEAQLSASDRRDLEERMAFLQKKEEEQKEAKSKKERLECERKALQLGKLHYTLSLLKRCIFHWKHNYIVEMRLLHQKVRLIKNFSYVLHYKFYHHPQYD